MIKNRSDFIAGLLCLLAGLGYAWAASFLEIGGSMDMGAGFFPLLLALLLMVAGGALLFRALAIETEGDGVPLAWNLQPLLWVLGALVLLGFAAHTSG